MVSPTGFKTLCPGLASLLFFGCQKKGVAIHAYSNSTSGKEQRSPPPPQSSKLDAMNESPSSKGGDDRDGAAQVSGTESSSAAAGNGEGEELSALYCTTRLPEPASDKTKSNPSVWEEEGRAAGGDKRFPFRFSPRNCLKSSPTPPELPPTSQLPSPLPPRGPEQQPAGKTRQSDSLVGSSSLGIVRPGKARKSINKENHWYQTKEVAEQDANNEQQLEEGRLEQRHRKELQPRPGSSTTNRRKSSGELPPSSMPKSGRNSVSSAVVPRWSLGSSSRNSALIKSQDSTPTANSTSLPPRVKRRSGSGSIAVEGSKSKAKAKARRTVIKSADMAEEMQQDALACTVKAMDEFDVDKDIAAFIKQEFDKKHGAKWHCVVGKNFGSFVTHETRGFVYLYRGQVAVLLFKAG